MIRRELIKAHCLSHRLAGQIHKCLRLHEHDGLAADIAGAGERFEAGAVYRRSLRLGHGVSGHEACVMTGHFVFRAGIAEEHDKPAYTAWTLEKHGLPLK